ncbi:MAG TPA: hypothetical protein DCG57_00335, partial [Candidatus Riflebacteria bacterium]|nr:hypothetical protein [Candidatus Riflebacteria bacterium]
MEYINNKHAFKLVTRLLACVFIFIAVAVSVLAADKQRIFDEANLLTDSERVSIQAELDKISREYAADFLIVTKEKLDGTSIQYFANDFFEKNGNQKGSGAILAISMQERDINFTAFGKIHDEHKRRLSQIRASIGKHMTAKRYHQAFMHFTELVRPSGFFGNFLKVAATWQPWVIALVVTLLVVGFLAYNHKGAITVGSSTYAVPGAFNLISSEDRYLRTTTTKTRISSSKSSSGGGGGR